MARRFCNVMLHRLRNEIPITELISNELAMETKMSEGVFRFLCPICSDFHTATNPSTNLGRCFRCKRNFNPIDMVMTVRKCSFVEAVGMLRRLTES